MPITGKDKEEMEKHLKENWRLEEGYYEAIIEDVNLVTAADGRRPLCWDLLIIKLGRNVQKRHWIDREGGVNFLINDLQSLGINVTKDNVMMVCNSLIGMKVEIEVAYHGEYQNINFLREL